MNRILVNLLFLISLNVCAQSPGTYYVAVDGDDNNPGTLAQPWATWQKGFDMATPGDTVYFRGGVYYNYDRVILGAYGHGTTGKADSIITFAGYPADIAIDNWPVLDCKFHCDSMTSQFGRVYNSAIEMYQVQYIHLKCLEVRNVYQCDSVLNGAITATSVANITYERLRVHGAGTGRGYWHTSGAWSLADVKFAAYYYDGNTQADTITINNAIFPQPDTTRWINCDVWNCIDTFRIPMSDAGNGGDAWKTISYYGNYYSWDGCRAWNYSDDGFDPNGGKRVLNNCWAMPSGKYAGFPATEGNGFKLTNAIVRLDWLQFLAPEDSAILVNDSSIRLNNCLALFSPSGSTSASAFLFGLEADTTENIRLNNCVSYYFSSAYRNDACDAVDTLGDAYRNCVAFYTTGTNPCGSPNILVAGGKPVFITNSTFEWMDGGYYQINSNYNLDSSDFVTTDSVTLVNLFTAPRQSEGSLPVNRPLMLSPTSDLIDGGVVAYNDQVYSGIAPDVGYHEFELTSCFEMQETSCINVPVDATYTGNASASATYYWDFGCATVISGSGQGPYVLQWPTAGCDTVSLYVEELNATSNTTAHEIYILTLGVITSDFKIQLHEDTLGPENAMDSICPGTLVDIIYTGNATDTATYYWDFGYAMVMSGSGQGPYTVQWPYGGFAAVSLYVEEFNLVSDTTTIDLYVNFDPAFTILPYPNDTVPVNDTIVLTADIASGSYLWSTGETTQSIRVFNAQPENMGAVQSYWLIVTTEMGCSSVDSITVVFDDPVLLNEFQHEIEMNVYPNPVNDLLNIEMEIVEQGEYIFEVFDNTGRPIIRKVKTFESGIQHMHLDMNFNTPGLYMLSVKSNKGMLGLRKIIKYSL
ncbi:T9SS type A sorting domain-containing protein [candidate division KSB1 bacterium]|nr:T9SS type A sorting domain-containing protein [candidate division KSB1 bacterium]